MDLQESNGKKSSKISDERFPCSMLNECRTQIKSSNRQIDEMWNCGQSHNADDGLGERGESIRQTKLGAQWTVCIWRAQFVE